MCRSDKLHFKAIENISIRVPEVVFNRPKLNAIPLLVPRFKFRMGFLLLCFVDRPCLGQRDNPNPILHTFVT